AAADDASCGHRRGRVPAGRIRSARGKTRPVGLRRGGRTALGAGRTGSGRTAPGRRPAGGGSAAVFEADRIAWTRHRLLVAGTKRIGRWLELLLANVDVRIHLVERLPDARAVTISGLHTPASFLRALARQAGGLDVRIHADGSLE